MLRLEGEGRKKNKKGQEEEHRHRQQPHRHRQQPRGPVQSRALPQGRRWRSSAAARRPRCAGPNSKHKPPPAAIRAPQSSVLSKPAAAGAPGQLPPGTEGVPEPPSPPEGAAAAAERLRRRTWKRSGAARGRPAPRPAGAKAGSKARRSALPPRCPSPSTRSAPRGEPGPPSPLEVCRSPGAGLPPSPAEPLRFTPKFRYNRNPGQHRLIKVVISLSTAKL